MTVPTGPEWSAAAKTGAHQAFANLLDAGTGVGLIRIRNSADALLVEIALGDPSGTVDVNGQLTLDAPLAGDPDATGTAAYAELCDSDGTVHLALPTVAGSTAVSGRLVLQTLSIQTGVPVEIVSAVIG